ncbi:hypothetical protein HF086_000796 [Spodoptera exigua]|uniref:Uncharacterized protein n=1 Tax=Spodoptera exigua TaxID=7107 RepID=A0A922SKL0_SPOEX|nr:hypothetical protein HF086_000796 [Spodoptera exigua]
MLSTVCVSSAAMQPTVSPWAWMSSLERRARPRGAAEHARPYAREHDKFALYGLRKDTRHFIRYTLREPLARTAHCSCSEITISKSKTTKSCGDARTDTVAWRYSHCEGREDGSPQDCVHNKGDLKHINTGKQLTSVGFVCCRLDTLPKGLLLNRQWAAPTAPPIAWRVDRFHDVDTWEISNMKVPALYLSSAHLYVRHSELPAVRPRVHSTARGQRTRGGGGSGRGGAAGAGSAAGAGGARPDPGGGTSWGHAARGWAAGAVALALLVLLVKAAENCLHKKLFKAIYMHTNAGAAELEPEVMRGHYRLRGVIRQDSDEWSTPNVMATTFQHYDCDVPTPERVRPLAALDRPPPYAAVARLPPSKPAPPEAPPPYSACAPGGPAAPELVFENGRIVEVMSSPARARAAPHYGSAPPPAPRAPRSPPASVLLV